MQIHELPEITSITSDGYLITDNGTQTTKIGYEKLAKAIIENYASSTLAGSAQSVKSAVNALKEEIIEIDPTLTQSGKAADAKATGDEIADLKSDLNSIESLFETELVTVTPTATVGYRWSKRDGSLVAQSTATAWECEAEEFTDYWLHGISTGNSTFPILFIDSNDEIISYIDDAVQSSGFKVLVRTPSGCVKIRYTSQTNTTWDAPPEKVVLKSLQEQTPIKQNTQNIGELKSDLNLVNDGYYSFDLIADKFILRDNGVESKRTGWSATDFIPLPSKCLVRYFGQTSLVWGARYDSNKVYVSPMVWNTQFNTFFNDTEDVLYFRTSGSNTDMESIRFQVLPVVDNTLTKTGYPADSKTVGDWLRALEAKSESIPAYYVSQLATKETAIRGHFDDCALNGDVLIFLTDTHYIVDLFTSASPSTTYNANNSLSLVKDVVAKCPIDKIVFGGDLVNTASDVDTMLLCMASFGTKLGNRQSRLRYCVGNHEYYTGSDLGATNKPTPSELYGAGIKYNEDVVLAKGDMDTYYFDNSAQKIRYFVVSCGRDTELTIPQVEWVLDAFLKIPDGYHVVVIGHAFMSDNMTTFRGRHQQIVNALDKVKIGGVFNYNNKNYDYSALNNVTPVCLITGHTHIDGSLTTSGGIPCICTTTDSYALNYELVDGTPTLTPRTKGTTDEQAFDVIQFDFTNRKIYCTRIGYGSDREFSY